MNHVLSWFTELIYPCHFPVVVLVKVSGSTWRLLVNQFFIPRDAAYSFNKDLRSERSRQGCALLFEQWAVLELAVQLLTATGVTDVITMASRLGEEHHQAEL